MPKVLGISPSGARGQVDEANVAEFIRRGGRLATPEENTAAKLDAEYAAKSTGDKVLQAATWGGVGPKSEAYLAAGRRALTGGVSEAVSKSARDLVDPGSGAAYAKHLDELEAAHPIASGAGSVAGLGTGIAMGEAGPLGALGELGKPFGAAASAGAKALVASGRVASTAAGVARGAIEGSILAGTEHVAHNVTHDTPEDGDKLFSAIGHGALLTGALGGVLGLAGHVLSSRAAGRVLSAAVPEAATEASPAVEAPRGGRFFDPDAGLYEKPGFAVEPIKIGAPKRSVWLNGDVEAGGKAGRGESPIELENRASINPDAAGLGRGEPAESPFKFLDAPAGRGASRAARRASIESGLHGAPDPRVVFGGGGFGDLAPVETSPMPDVRRWSGTTVSPDAGLQELAPGGRDAHVFDLSENAHVPGDVKFRVGNETAPVDAREAFPFEPAAERPATPREPTGSIDPLTDAAIGDMRQGGIIPKLAGVADEYGPKLARKVVGKVVRKAVGSAVGGLIGHTVGGPVGAMAGMAAGSAVSDYAETALMKAGGVRGVLDGWGARLHRSASGVLDADAPLGGKTFGADPNPPTASDPRAEAQARQSTAQAIVKWIGDIRENPDRIQAQLENAANTVARSAGPNASAAYTAAALRAIDFIAAHIPIKERRDPFDPRRSPPLNSDEADRLNRAARYAAQPWTIYDDFSRGRIYPEGIRAAKTFSPNEFAAFQVELQEQAQDRVMRDPTLTQAQRLRLDKLLGYPAGATMQKSSITRLQQNMLAPLRASPVGAMGEGSAPPAAPAPPPIKLTIDHSGFGDNLEARRASGG